MKKVLLLIVGILILSGPAFAEEVQGPIRSIDAVKNEIVVNDGASGMDKTVTVHPKIISTLKEGSVVKVSLKPGTNAADTLETKIEN